MPSPLGCGISTGTNHGSVVENDRKTVEKMDGVAGMMLFGRSQPSERSSDLVLELSKDFFVFVPFS